MQRIPHNTDLSLRLVFSDADNSPVPMKDVDFEMWFSTRPGTEAYLAACRSGISLNCSILDDCSVLVSLDNHRLPPGLLKTQITIHADSEIMPDGCHDIRVSPNIPVELVDSHCLRHSHSHTPQAPVLVNVTLPLHRPNLTHHITQKELDEALKGFNINLSAKDDDIAEIIALYSDL